MTERVVDELEAIEIEEEQRQRRIVGRAVAEQLHQLGLELHPVRQLGERVVGGLMAESRFGVGVVAQGPEHPQAGRGHQRQHDAGQRDAVHRLRVGLGEHHEAGHADRDRDQHEATARCGHGDRHGLGDPLHRRVQRGRGDQHVGQAVRKIDPTLVRQEVQLDEHVERVADEHGDQRAHPDAERDRRMTLGREADAEAGRDEEGRERGIQREGDPRAERHALLLECRCDEEDPRQRERGQTGDQRIERRDSVVPAITEMRASHREQADAERDVAEHGERLGVPRPARREIAERAEHLAEHAAHEEQQHRHQPARPHPTRARAVPHDPVGDRAGGAGGDGGEGQRVERAEKSERVSAQPRCAYQRADDCRPAPTGLWRSLHEE